MKVTLKDIALEANVSITTVSHVINNKPGRVSDAMREKIMSIAKEKKYVPNYTAKQLVTRKSNAIGIIVPDLENYFFASMVSRFQSAMRDQGYFVLVVTSDDDVENDINGIELLVSRGVELLLVAVSNNAHNHVDTYLSEFKSLSIPTIMLDRIIDQYEGPKIRFNDLDGMTALTNYVVSQNHTNIAFVTGDQNKFRTASRAQGFLQSMTSHNLVVHESDIYDGNYSYESGYELFDKIYDQMKYTAIIAANDMMAYGLMKRAFEKGLNIPEDISITGYDNVKFSEMLNPTLTTVHQNMDLMISESLRLIKILLKDKSYNENVILDTQLIHRNSVKRI